MTDFRALCIELTDCLEKADWPLRYRYVFRQWVDIARAALADEPAVLDGREPASVTGQPSDEELLETLDKATATFPPRHPEAEGLNAVEYPLALELRKARAVLGRWGNPAPPPADGEVAELVAWLRERATWCTAEDPAHKKYDRAAELLQRQALVPVSVSERLPGPEDCDAEGRCWVGYPELTYSIADTGDTDTTTPEWRLEHQPLKPKGSRCCWLPFHALPLPQGEVE